MSTPQTSTQSAETDNALLDIEALESYLLAAMEKWQVPGLSLAIVKDGKTVLAKGYGVRETGKEQAVDQQTLFPIAGSTMSFTAAALAILVDEQRLNWTDRMIDLLPGFQASSDLITHTATITDVLAHKTGLPVDSLSFYPNPGFSRAEILRRIKHIKPSSEFRAQSSPNFQMYTAAGEVIPVLTDISWDDFVSERLFKPIGMTDSITGPDQFGNKNNIARPHETIEGNLTAVLHANTSNVGPAVSIYSSAADMAKWLNFQLNLGKVGENPLISPEQINIMRRSHNTANYAFPEMAKHFINHGFGLMITDSSQGGHKFYSFGGNTEGTESYHAFAPELGLGIAVMVNSSTVIPQPLVAWIIDRYTGAPDRDWISERTPVYEAGIESALTALDEKQKAITDPSTSPSVALSCYGGGYRHPLVGDLNITERAGALSYTLGSTYQGELTHANHDTFFSRVKKPYLGQFFFSGPAQFRLDVEGEVISVVIAGREFLRVD
ncbi:MAG: serine hydrolase [Porticoccaceae bacterium]|nr:serine hydrolase [Porticoccaceae bacterium]